MIIRCVSGLISQVSGAIHVRAKSFAAPVRAGTFSEKLSTLLASSARHISVRSPPRQPLKWPRTCRLSITRSCDGRQRRTVRQLTEGWAAAADTPPTPLIPLIRLRLLIRWCLGYSGGRRAGSGSVPATVTAVTAARTRWCHQYPRLERKLVQRAGPDSWAVVPWLVSQVIRPLFPLWYAPTLGHAM